MAFGLALFLLGCAFPDDGALDDATIVCGLVMMAGPRVRWELRRWRRGRARFRQRNPDRSW